MRSMGRRGISLAASPDDLMPSSRIRRLFSALLVFLLVFAAPLESAPRKKKASAKKAATRVKPRATPRPAAPAVPQGRTFEERLASLVNSPVARNSTASIQVVHVQSGRVVAERNPDLAIAPASNMKLFTTAAALDLLSSEFEFKTTMAMRGAVDNAGTLTGDVKITGGGDPTIGGRFHDGRATAVLDEFASDLKRAGVQTISGDLIFEYGYFDTEYVHPTWPRDQLVNWYEAPVASLSMQEGTVLVRVLPGRPGQRAIVQLEPPNRYVTVQNTAVTSGGRGVFITRRLGTNEIIVRGGVPPRSGATEVYVAIENPVHYFASVTRDTFERNGIRLNGEVKLVDTAAGADWRMVSQHRTPLPVVSYVINKVSQNHYAEQLLKTLGAEKRQQGSFASGATVVDEWLHTKVGVPQGEFSMVDGSGMSRFNRASASAFTDLLRYMWSTPHRRDFVSSMPYSGEPDSRLRRRLNQPPYARQVYAKTGYISGVIGLSGYVHAQSGQIYAFSFLFNRYPSGVWGVYNLQDEMLKEIIRSG
jgi:D-alanyl-D-alanine carboxypeptidase/D-alanyl-D-alanine-endopeptidase (penicillin-binding protein 4)